MSRILVTGANGLAGSAVAAYFRQTGHEVIAVTRDKCDLTDMDYVSDLFFASKPEYVFHGAALVYGLGGASKNHGRQFHHNTIVDNNVIEMSRHVGVQKIIAMGSNTIYPWPAQLPYREENIFDGRVHAAESGYANSKRAMLAMLEAYHESYKLQYTYLVSGNLYGPNDKFDIEKGHVIPSMIAKFDHALTTDGIVNLWGDGTSQRDFLYSGDLARIVGKVMFNQSSGAMNTGSGAIYPISEVALRLSQISGVSYNRVHYDKTKPNGRPNCTSDLSRLRALNFKPEWGLHKGLESTWDWYQAREQ